MSIPIVLTKISAPARRSHWLSRPRLLDFLQQRLDQKLTVVAAPAGYGKTSLLVDFARQTTLPVAWYSLDPSDADPHVFGEYLVAAMRRLFPDAFPQTLSLLASAQFPRDPAENRPAGKRGVYDGVYKFDALSAALVNEISAIPSYFAFVLDDFHCVNSSESVYAILEALLRRMPENLHLILASRTVPTRMPLLRMAARQESAGLSANDLRFHVEELTALAQQNQWPDLDPARLRALLDFSEGWIAGILLVGKEDGCALSQARPLLRPAGRNGETQIFDFFAAEVFARETPALREFLMQSAVLDELSKPVVAALWGDDAVERLLDVERRNLFVNRIESPTAGGESPVSENGNAPLVTWRYHALFRHFLLTRFRETAPAEMRDWQKRAAGYFERSELWDLAIKHYREAGELEDVARVIDHAAEAMMNRGRFQTLAEWIDALSPDRLTQFPNLLLQRGLLYHREGDRAQGEALLLQAETVYRSRGNALGLAAARQARAETYNTMGRLRENVAMVQETLQMLASDDDDPATPRESAGSTTPRESAGSTTPRESAGSTMCAARARLHNSLGVAYARLGELARGQSELEESIRCHLLAGTPVGELAMAHHNLGATLTVRGSPDAEAHYLTALRLYPPGEFSRMRCMSRNSLGVVYYYRGEYARALEMLEPARDEAARGGDLYAYCTIMASLADLRRDQGDLEQAQADYREALASARRIRASFITVYAQTALAELDCRWHVFGALPASQATHNICTCGYRGCRCGRAIGGHLAAADEQVAEADEQARSSGSWTDELMVQLAHGILERARGDPDASDREFRTASALAERIGARREQVRAELHLAVADLRRDDTGAFGERMGRIARLARELGETQVLLSEAPWVSEALQRAVERGIEARLYRAALQRVCPTCGVEASARITLTATEPSLRVQAFGNGAVWVAGKEILASEWESTIARDLFFLVLSSSTGLRKEQILDALWGDLDIAKATERLYPSISRVRGVIPRSEFFRDGERYRVRRDDGLVYDVDLFERRLREADMARKPDEQAERLRSAVALYRGVYLEDCYRDWAAPLRARLEQAFLRALLRLARLEEKLGRADLALADYQRLWEQDGLNEEVVQAIMRLYARQGNRVAVAEIYRQYTAILRRELNARPSRQISELYRRILANSVSGAMGLALFHGVDLARWALQAPWALQVQWTFQLVLLHCIPHWRG